MSDPKRPLTEDDLAYMRGVARGAPNNVFARCFDAYMHLRTAYDAQKAEVERLTTALAESISSRGDSERDRRRRCAQMLIESIGANGPEDLEHTVSRAVARIEMLKVKSSPIPAPITLAGHFRTERITPIAVMGVWAITPAFERAMRYRITHVPSGASYTNANDECDWPKLLPLLEALHAISPNWQATVSLARNAGESSSVGGADGASELGRAVTLWRNGEDPMKAVAA